MELYRIHRDENVNEGTKFFMNFNFLKIPKNIYQVKPYQCQLLKEIHSHLH